MKTIILLGLTILIFAATPANKNYPSNLKKIVALKISKSDVHVKKLNKRVLYFQLQSPTYLDNGPGACSYWFTAVVAYQFDDITGVVTGVAMSSPVLNVSCPQGGGYARSVIPELYSSAITLGRGMSISSISFQLTGDATIDKFLSNSQFLLELKNQINDNVPVR